VIVKGTVKLKSHNRKDFGESAPPVVIKTLYDGDHIGEVTVVEANEQQSEEELNKKRNSAIACEPTTLIKIDKRKTQNLFNRGNQNLESRIDFMLKLELFESIDRFLLLSLANAVDVQTYNYGDVILKEGSIPKGLYIITQGQCVAASKKVVLRTAEQSKFSRYYNEQGRFITSLNTSPQKKEE
jgi:hypothetical protein